MLWAALIAGAMFVGPQAASAAAPEGPQALPAASWILVDAASGDVLAERSPDETRPIASATKLMTAYLALRELRPRERVVAPAYAAGPAESLLGLRAGERISVRDLLYGMLLPSGNDAAAALAQAVSGSVPEFVDLMNRTADRLGLEDTTYGDPIGLDPASASSASDLARLALRLREVPLFRRIVDTPRKKLRSGAVTRTVTNRNDLVLQVPWVSGIKTGQTLDAGFVLVASGERKGATLVAAVLGAPSEAARDQASLDLLRYGASLYERREPVAEGDRLASAAIRFRDERLPLLADGSVSVSVRPDQDVDLRLDLPQEVEGPLERGERVGAATVAVEGEVAGRVPLVAARAVAAPSLLERADDAIPGGRTVLWLVAGTAGLLLACLVSAGVARARAR